MTTDWQAIRGEFPALSNWTYLNSATFGQMPRRATEAVARHFGHRDEQACSDFLSWFDDADRIRGAAGKLIGCQAEDVAFITNTSTGLATVVAGLDWKPGDRAVTLADEFPNFLYLPALLDRFGVEFVQTPWENFQEAITPRTRLVALSSVHYTTGFRPPLADIARLLHERGALLFVDGTQSVGALRMNVGEIRPDVLAVHGYKWLLSPTGAGFLYVRPGLRERLPANVVGWRSHKTWRDVANLHLGAPEFKTDAEKFEGGMLDFPALYAMEASINLMLEIGPEEIERRVLGLAATLRGMLRDLGAAVRDDDSQIVAGRFDGRDVPALARELKARRILVAARHGHLRVSPHFYNNEEDLARFERELRGLLG